MKQKIRLSESDLHKLIKECVKNVLEEIEEGYGVNRPEDSMTGLAKSLMGDEDAWRGFYKDSDKNHEDAFKHGNGGQYGNQQRMEKKRAVSSQDPLALRQRMNQLGNDPQDTLRKSREYSTLNLQANK